MPYVQRASDKSTCQTELCFGFLDILQSISATAWCVQGEEREQRDGNKGETRKKETYALEIHWDPGIPHPACPSSETTH